MKPYVGTADLHSHSTASDGALKPEELVSRAAARGLTHLALTDHDNASGGAQAQKAAGALGVTLIPGAEISTTWNNAEIHIVGLFLDLSTPALQQFFKGQLERRQERAEEIGRRLERQGFEHAYERTKAMAREGAVITRGNYARYIASTGRAQSTDDAFNTYLKKGRSAYVSTLWPDIAEACAVIARAGGVSVLAHPRRYDFTNSKLRRLITYFVSCGGRAMEVASCQQRPCDREFLAKLSVEYALKASLGSDLHQPSPWRDLGLSLLLPPECSAVWTCPEAETYFKNFKEDPA